MSKEQTRELDYFPFETNFFGDKKIKVLKSRYGADGVVVYIYLLTEIYKDEGYYLKVDDDVNYILSEDLNMSPDKIGQIMNFLLERSLFDNTLFKSDKVLTSRGIQRRFQKAIAVRAAKTPARVLSEYWLLDEDETKGYIKCIQNENNSKKNTDNSKNIGDISKKKTTKESKVNKSKVNKSSVVVQYDDTDLFKKPSVCHGSLTKGVIILSDEQMDELAELMPLNVLNHYLNKLADFIISKKAVVRNHFETIKKWYEEDYGG